MSHGLSSIKAGYKDEKEEMSENNIEVYTLGKDSGFTKMSDEMVREKIMDLEQWKTNNS